MRAPFVRKRAGASTRAVSSNFPHSRAHARAGVVANAANAAVEIARQADPIPDRQILDCRRKFEES